MVLEEKIRFLLGTLGPVAEHTFPYLTSIIGVRDKAAGVHIGSGFRCLLSGRRVIVTAAHVIEEARSYPHFAVSAGDGFAPFLVHGHLRIDPRTDLALLFVPEEFPADRPDVAFWPEERIDPSGGRLATDYLFVHGFPGVRSFASPMIAGIANKSLPYGAMQRIDDLPVGLEPWQFALNFDPRNIEAGPGGTPDFLPDPHGLSGSPVFRIGLSGGSAKDWSPELTRFVGVVTQWMQDAELILAVGASELVALARRETSESLAHES
jgi:hypothetical protein